MSPSCSNISRLSAAVSAHRGLRVDQAAAGPFDHRDRLQRPRPGRRRPVVARHQPGQHFTALEVAAEVPEHAERPGHRQRRVEVAVRAAEPGQRGPDVGLLLAQQAQGLRVARARAAPSRLLERMPRKYAACRRATSSASPTAASCSAAYWRKVSSIRYRVVAPGSTTSMDRSTSRPSVEDVARGHVLVGDDGLGRLSVQPPRKTESRLNTRCSGSREQLVAPVDRGPQRLLPGLGGPGAGGEQGEPVREPLGDLDR